MAAVGGFNGIHREGPDGIGQAAVGGLHRGSVEGAGTRQIGRADDAFPLVGERFAVNACGAAADCLPAIFVNDAPLSSALDRAERALQRIERALAAPRPEAAPRDEELRAKVREVVEELDELIRQAAA